MKELIKVYQDRGSQFIEDLLKDYVVITEKLSGSSFSFQKNGQHLSFYKGDNRKPLNLIDRTLMIYYEPPIKYISSISPDILKEVPDNWRFGFQYFVHNNPGVITYDKMPKNSLVLTHILVKDHRDKTAKVIEDPRVIKDWANKLGVTPMQPIFMGHLTETQKEKLLTFLDIPVEDQMELFGTNSFVEYLITYLNPSVKSTLLNTDLTKPIDSIVFKFYKPGSTQTYSAKVVDPYTRSLMKEKEPIDMRRAPADINEIVLLDILAFLEERGLKKHEVLSQYPEEKYLELISGLFNDYVDKRGKDLAKLDFQKADFAKAPEFDINYDLLRNEKTKELISGSDALKDLFKVMLGSLRKKRDPQKEGPLFTPSVIGDFNKMVDRIKKITEEEGDGQFKTFEDYLKLKNINEEIYIKEDLMDLICEETYLNFKDFVNLEKFAIHEALRVPHKNQGKKKVNMFAGRFQPFTLGHLKVLEDLHKQNGHPVMVMIVRGKKTDPKRTPFDEDTQQRMVAALQKQYPFIEGSVVVPNGAIDTMFSSLRPTYEPVLWGYGTDRKKSYDGQIQHDGYRTQLGVLPEFQGHEIKRGDEDVSASKVRNALERDDRKGYEKLVPRSLHDFYDELKNIMVPIEESEEMNEAKDPWKISTKDKQKFWDSYHKNVEGAKPPINTKSKEIIRSAFGLNNGEVASEAAQNIKTMFDGAGVQISPTDITYHKKGDLGSKDFSSKYPTYEISKGDETYFVTNNGELAGAATMPEVLFTKHDLGPADLGLTQTEFKDPDQLIKKAQANMHSKNWPGYINKAGVYVDDQGQHWAAMLTTLMNIVAGGQPETYPDINVLIEVSHPGTVIEYEVSSLFGPGKEYENFVDDKKSWKALQDNFGEILGGLMMFDIIQKSGWETLLFPQEMNYPLADFLWGNNAISSKGAKGASPGVKDAFEKIATWYRSKKKIKPLSSPEQSFYDNVVLPFNQGVKGKSYTYDTVRNIGNKHLGDMGVWKYITDQIGNTNLTEADIAEWVKGLYEKNPVTGKEWKAALSAIEKLLKKKGRGFRGGNVNSYWTAFQKYHDTKKGWTEPDSALISAFMYPVTVDMEVMLNDKYGPNSSDKSFTSLMRKALQVQQVHLWVGMSTSTLTFEFRPFSSNDFTFAAKGTMSNYKNKALSFHLTL